ncbi:hypothetical protein V6N13_127337 [Hibiscus sabdariffa]
MLLEVDNGDVTQIVYDPTQVTGLHGLVPSIKELLDKAWVVRVRQIRRSTNMVADGMVKLSWNSYVSSLHDMGFVIRVFLMSLDEIVSLVHDDVSPIMGVV